MTAKELLGIRRGDVVKVKGLRGDFRVTGWREESGGLVVDLIGGTPGHRMFRSIDADRVKPTRRPLRWGGGGHAA